MKQPRLPVVIRSGPLDPSKLAKEYGMSDAHVRWLDSLVDATLGREASSHRSASTRKRSMAKVAVSSKAAKR